MKKSNVRSLLLFAISLLSFSFAHAASLNLSGNHRFGSSMFVNLDLDPGKPNDTGNTASYLEHRLLLRPDIAIDEHFSIKSTLNLFQLKDYPIGSNSTSQRFGSPLDSSATSQNGKHIVDVQNAYLNWNNDFGLFRVGRMPKHWGLGIIYDSGENVYDDYSSTTDGISFQSLVGSLNLKVGYEKPEENHMNSDHDDVDLYHGSVEFLDQENRFNIGILYERVIRSAASSAHQNLQLKSAHNVSLFARKRWSQVDMGAELATISYNKDPDVVGVLSRFKYKPGALYFDAEFAYSNKNQENTFLFNSNYRPLLILYRQNVGPLLATRQVRSGGPFGAAISKGDGGGAYLGMLGMGYGFSDDRHILDTKVGYLRLEEQGTSPSKSLGVEWDINFLQTWYENFKTSYRFGVVFPGNGFGANSRIGWGLQLNGHLVF
jgi:hypothetical protein